MPAKDLGTKHVCYKCQTKFYDMKKPDPICPKCGADQRESPALKPQPEGRRGRLAAAPKVIEPIEPEEPAGRNEEDEEEGLDSFDDDEPAGSESEEDEV